MSSYSNNKQIQRAKNIITDFSLARISTKRKAPVISVMLSTAVCDEWISYLHGMYICILQFLMREFARVQNSVRKRTLTKTPAFQ